MIKKLLNWRKHKKVIHSGKLMQFAPEHGMYAYFRYFEVGGYISDVVMAVFNKNESDLQVETSGYNEVIMDLKTGRNILDNKVNDLNDLVIPARSVLVLEIE